MCREGLSFITLFMLFIIKRAILFTPQNWDLLEELQTSVRMVRRVGSICKTEGFSIDTCKKCQDYIVCYVIGNANNRRAMLGVKMLEYFKKHEMLLADTKQNHKISSDIIASDFGIYKDKKSPDRLFGISPFILFIPLHSKFMNESVTKTFNFKERLCNIKLRDIDTLLEKSTCPLIGVQYEPKTSEM